MSSSVENLTPVQIYSTNSNSTFVTVNSDELYNIPYTTTYRVGSNFEICVKRITDDNSPFDSFELFLAGTGNCKLILKSNELNYEKEFIYNINEVNPEKIHWLTEKNSRINLLKIRIPKREFPRANILNKRRQKRENKKVRNEIGKLRRLPNGDKVPMDADEAFYECIELQVKSDSRKL